MQTITDETFKIKTSRTGKKEKKINVKALQILNSKRAKETDLKTAIETAKTAFNDNLPNVDTIIWNKN